MRDVKYFELVRYHFWFLEQDYGYRVVSGEPCDVVLYVTYTDDTTVVRVTRDRREEYVYVEFMDVAGWNEMKARGKVFLLNYRLETLVRLRCPDFPWKTTSQSFEGLTTEWLALMSRALRLCADDILRGDHSVFPELAELSRKRHEEYWAERNKSGSPVSE